MTPVWPEINQNAAVWNRGAVHRAGWLSVLTRGTTENISISSTPSGAARNQQLDGLRGYAALSVAIYHTILGMDLSQIDRILRPSIQDIGGSYAKETKIVLALVNGETAVVVFFILSGAVLFRSLQRAGNLSTLLAAAFLVRRFLRIYPALFVCLAVCATVFPWIGISLTVGQFVQNILLIDFPVNGATWTLNVELLAVPFILLAYGGYCLGREIGLLIVVLVLYAVIKLPIFVPYLVGFKGAFYCFALGMLVPTRIGEWVARRNSLLWISALIGLLFARHIILIGDLNTAGKLQQTCGFILVTQLYYGCAIGLGRILQTKVALFLGYISYSFYLWNVLFLEIVKSALHDRPFVLRHPLEVGLGASVIVVVLSIPIALLSVRLLENPFIEMGSRAARWIGGGLKTVPA
jgi:peptidoglycan/LPS O-acetylase OafA/YrhL